MARGELSEQMLSSMSNPQLVAFYVVQKFLDRDALIQDIMRDLEEEGHFDARSESEEESDSQDRSFRPDLSNIDMSKIPKDLQEEIGLRGSGDHGGDGGSKSRTVDQDRPPSMGSGHRGAVTDPEHDKRLKSNEDEELHQKRVEAGRKGGESRGGRREEDQQSVH